MCLTTVVVFLSGVFLTHLYHETHGCTREPSIKKASRLVTWGLNFNCMNKCQVGVYQPNKFHMVQLIHYTWQRNNPIDRTFLGDWSSWGNTGMLLSLWAFILANKGGAMSYWKVLRMATEEWSSSKRPEMPFAMNQWQAPSFNLLCLSPCIRVFSWQAEHKNLNHCSLVYLLGFLTTTELHKSHTVFCFNLFASHCS